MNPEQLITLLQPSELLWPPTDVPLKSIQLFSVCSQTTALKNARRTVFQYLLQKNHALETQLILLTPGPALVLQKHT